VTFTTQGVAGASRSPGASHSLIIVRDALLIFLAGAVLGLALLHRSLSRTGRP
jgi:hypothetical protein